MESYNKFAVITLRVRTIRTPFVKKSCTYSFNKKSHLKLVTITNYKLNYYEDHARLKVKVESKYVDHAQYYTAHGYLDNTAQSSNIFFVIGKT